MPVMLTVYVGCLFDKLGRVEAACYPERYSKAGGGLNTRIRMEMLDVVLGSEEIGYMRCM
jgi:hypothetical protein